MGDSLSIEFVGHATVLVALDTVRLLTDPALQSTIGPLRRTGGLPVPVPPDVDAVLISHLHLDHLDLPSLDRLGRDRKLVVPRGAARWLRTRGFADVEELGPGETTSVGGVRVRAVRARHGGFRPPVGPTAAAIGYVLEGSRTVYFAGDTGLFDGMADLRGSIDVALLPVGGWGPTRSSARHLDPTDAARAAGLIRPRVSVPIHWGTYWPMGFGWIRRWGRHGAPTRFIRAASELAPDAMIRATDIGAEVDLR
ncbi:MAG TPA: MBL fold metallo-hydrolase [Candidatus Limnocylindrales bacterium]|nr:MBL fold metallo-hydrolase [Candidatus Limnocylindrales bacterium]